MMRSTAFLILAFNFLFTVHAFKVKLPQLEDRIVGGVEIDIKDAPWQISLQLNKSHHCGGSIVDKSFVLTAAHCTKGLPTNSFSVRVGSLRHDEGGQIVGIESVLDHENFDPRTADYDYSLLKLISPLDFTDAIQPIALPDVDEVDIPDGSMCIVSGWGTTMNATESELDLRATKVPIVNQQVCREKNVAVLEVTPRMICAGYDEGGKDACQGDSGGPLSCIDPTDGVRKVYGVVSWGYDCAQKNYPGVYARVTAVRTWIRDTTGF